VTKKTESTLTLRNGDQHLLYINGVPVTIRGRDSAFPNKVKVVLEVGGDLFNTRVVAGVLGELEFYADKELEHG
jgi:hypothetical protein